MHRGGVEGEIVFLPQPEDADEIDRIAPERVRVGDVDAIVVDREVIRIEHQTCGPRPKSRWMSNESRSSARPVTKCMWQRTAQRKSSARRNILYSCRSNTPRSISSSAPCTR